MTEEEQKYYAGLGYRDIRELPNGELAGLLSFAFTIGIVVGIERFGYRIRYCYGQYSEARKSLEAWDGKGDPPGEWIKAKGRDRDGRVRDEPRKQQEEHT